MRQFLCVALLGLLAACGGSSGPTPSGDDDDGSSSICGDGVCAADESASTCSQDCVVAPSCGDHTCNGAETCATCAADCGVCPPVCGDHSCNGTESCVTCSQDCGACPATCGDGQCLGAENCDVCAEDCGACPELVNIELIGAVVGPAKLDHTEWDGTNTVSPQDLAQVATALGAPEPYTAVLSVLAQLAQLAYSKPDPVGIADLAWNGGFDPTLTVQLGTEDTNVEDTYTPEWPSPPVPGWVNVPFHSGLRVRVKLEDEDFVNNDVIGTVELNYQDLLTAWTLQQTYAAPVFDQSQQLLFVTISVTSAGP